MCIETDRLIPVCRVNNDPGRLGFGRWKIASVSVIPYLPFLFRYGGIGSKSSPEKSTLAGTVVL